MKLHERIAAVKASRVDGSCKLLLMVLASYAAEDEDRPVWPSVRTLADDCGLNKDTVSARMDELRRMGLVEQTARHGMGRSARHVVRWDLVSEAVGRPKRSDVRSLRTGRSELVGHEDPTPSDTDVRTGRTKQFRDQRDEQSKETVQAREPGRPPAEEVSPTTGGAVGMVLTTGSEQPRLALPSATAITGRPSDAMGGGRAAASGEPALLLDGAPDGGAGRRRRGASARRSGPPTDAEMQAWGAIVQSWQQISGRLPNWSPEAGTGEHIIRQIRALGAERLVQRFREAEKVTFILQKAREPDGLKIDALLRAENGLVGPLDRAVADRSVRDAFKRPPDASAARVATMTLPEPSERSQVPRNTTGDALAAWEETAEARRRCVRTSPPYLDHGPRLSPDPDEHRRRADAWRQGLWAEWCQSTHPLDRDRIRDRWMQAYRGAL